MQKTGTLPNSVAPLAEMLRLNGYSTGAFGKWHETAAWETSLSGPFDRWPTHQGFDKFYGFIGGETDQWYPLVYDGVTRVTPPKTKDYHFTTDMTEQAVNWIRAQQSLTHGCTLHDFRKRFKFSKLKTRHVSKRPLSNEIRHLSC
ncbi:sulfatase-like hydrolase/transferase [Bremerella sp. P1]|uniref:sulfatase-like hydrolase/transferase n=1 Tax=Bremerella sp. P1 TaxID=3026424 RepID=UPI002367E221|nr:sulfatase-like hydrolase/transferase [Bremerella sp. P1]WDI39892.1 sulfatase-like hydrolase/transferase [Bremerella sp. P1]